MKTVTARGQDFEALNRAKMTNYSDKFRAEESSIQKKHLLVADLAKQIPRELDPLSKLPIFMQAPKKAALKEQQAHY